MLSFSKSISAEDQVPTHHDLVLNTTTSTSNSTTTALSFLPQNHITLAAALSLSSRPTQHHGLASKMARKSLSSMMAENTVNMLGGEQSSNMRFPFSCDSLPPSTRNSSRRSASSHSRRTSIIATRCPEERRSYLLSILTASLAESQQNVRNWSLQEDSDDFEADHEENNEEETTDDGGTRYCCYYDSRVVLHHDDQQEDALEETGTPGVQQGEQAGRLTSSSHQPLMPTRGRRTTRRRTATTSGIGQELLQRKNKRNSKPLNDCKNKQ